MSSLLENIILKNQKIDFDFTKSLNSNTLKSNHDTPIAPKQSDWHEEDNRLICYFSFSSTSHVIYFINLILEKSITMNHHPDIFISHNDIKISLQTKDIEQITNIDLKFAKFITDVYEDTKFIRNI
tara:strand:- start:1232 stop:1609 length:378 start_codon:yes stop_codon:yes gene_type:complete